MGGAKREHQRKDRVELPPQRAAALRRQRLVNDTVEVAAVGGKEGVEVLGVGQLRLEALSGALDDLKHAIVLHISDDVRHLHADRVGAREDARSRWPRASVGDRPALAAHSTAVDGAHRQMRSPARRFWTSTQPASTCFIRLRCQRKRKPPRYASITFGKKTMLRGASSTR